MGNKVIFCLHLLQELLVLKRLKKEEATNYMFDQMSTWQLYQMYSYFLRVNSLIKNIYMYIVQDKKAFADILRKISKIQRTNGSNYVVLRDR